MARPGRPERNRAARSFRQLRRFHHVINSDKVFGTHKLRSATEVASMNGNRYYGVRVEGAKYGVGFGSALAIAISYTANHSILWAIIHGILGWLYVIYFALFWS